MKTIFNTRFFLNKFKETLTQIKDFILARVQSRNNLVNSILNSTLSLTLRFSSDVFELSKSFDLVPYVTENLINTEKVVKDMGDNSNVHKQAISKQRQPFYSPKFRFYNPHDRKSKR